MCLKNQHYYLLFYSQSKLVNWKALNFIFFRIKHLKHLKWWRSRRLRNTSAKTHLRRPPHFVGQNAVKPTTSSTSTLDSAKPPTVLSKSSSNPKSSVSSKSTKHTSLPTDQKVLCIHLLSLMLKSKWMAIQSNLSNWPPPNSDHLPIQYSYYSLSVIC